VLSELATIRLGVGYRCDGRDLPSVPADLAMLERVEVVFEELPGWQCDISGVRAPAALLCCPSMQLPALALSARLIAPASAAARHKRELAPAAQPARAFGTPLTTHYMAVHALGQLH